MNRVPQLTLAAWLCASVAAWAAAPAAPETFPQVDGKGRIVDLSRHYNKRFNAPNYKGPGKELPTLKPVFDGLPFNLTGQITLWGITLSDRNQYFLVAAKDIPVDSRFDELHLVHFTQWPDVAGQVVGRVRLNYSDGSRHEFPIVYGVQVGDWAFLPSYETETLSDPETKVIWRDPQLDNNNLKCFRRLWKTRFMNPHPEKPVRTIDFLSGRRSAHYSIIAATIAARDDQREQTPALPFNQPARKFTGAIKLKVLDAVTGKPIAGALVDPGTTTRGAGVVAEQLLTDQAGEAVFKYWKEETSDIYMTIRAEGYGPASRDWSATIDGNAEFRLQPGETIGGFVKDGAGAPVDGAAVKLNELIACTDAEGRWSLKGVAPRYGGHSLEVGHPDFPPTSFRMDSDVSLADLGKQTAVLVVQGGMKLSGVVKDGEGKPVADAQVFFGNTQWDHAKAETRTDAEGRFTLKQLPAGASYVTVQASRMAPEFVRVEVGPKTAPLSITMKKGHLLKGKVVDENGKPLEGVTIMADRLQEPRTLRFRFTTKADGKFIWGAAPDEEVSFYFHKDGLRDHRQTCRPGKGDEIVIQLGGAATVKGEVLDAETGKPISEFKVMTGVAWSDDQLSFPRGPVVTGRNGQFAFKLDGLESNDNGILSVEAGGYLPALSPAFPAVNPPADFQFKLKRGEGPRGVVLLPDGRPAAGAKVALNSRGAKASLRDGELISPGGHSTALATAASDGNFTLSARAEPTGLVAAHAEGFTFVSLETFKSGGAVRLQPWGRFTGTVTEDGKPLPKEPVHLAPKDWQTAAVNLQFAGFQRRSDAAGRVTFERLPPGEFQFIRLLESGEGERRFWMHLSSVPVQIEAGKTATARLEVGLRFRAVQGQITVPGATNLNLADIQVELVSHTPVKSQGGKVAGDKPYQKELADQGYVNPHFKVKPDAEGRFRVAGVPAGNYGLSAVLEGDPVPGTAFRQQLGRLAAGVTVTATEDDNPKPQDLGTHAVLLFLKEGDPAPGFEIKTVDGNPVKLADYRGKYVLLDFWATWCGPCVAETPNLKQTFEEFGKDSRFAMIGLSMDSSPNEPRRYAQSKEAKWINGFIGGWNAQEVSKAYRVHGIPQILLIGPDGKIIAKDLRGDGIRAAVAKALKPPQ